MPNKATTTNPTPRKPRAKQKVPTGPSRRPGNEIEDHGNIARAGSGQRRDRSTVGGSAGAAHPRPGSKVSASAKRTGISAKRNAASQPRG
jgi:hypothetical protein